MKIPSNILADITSDVSNLLADAAEAHMETGRRATVTLKLTMRSNATASGSTLSRRTGSSASTCRTPTRWQSCPTPLIP